MCARLECRTRSIGRSIEFSGWSIGSTLSRRESAHE
jgi:hypothetical protein